MRLKPIITTIFFLALLVLGSLALPKLFNKLEEPSQEPQHFSVERREETLSPVTAPAAVSSAVPLSEEEQIIQNGLIGLGDTMVFLYNDSKVTIKAVSLSDDLSSAGWTKEEISSLDFTVTTNGTDYLPLTDCIDNQTGKLSPGLTLVTVEVTVELGAGNSEGRYGPQLFIVDKDSGKVNETTGREGRSYSFCALSYPGGDRSFHAWVPLRSGESMDIRLGYVLDADIEVNQAYLASYMMPVREAAFLPLSLADQS